MAVHIVSADRLVVGDHVDHEGAGHTVTEAVVWSDAWGEYVHTEATLEPDGGGDD